MQNPYKKGFTLIELLVVIAIIGVLSAIVLIAVGQSKKKAQFAETKAEMIQLRNAVELYKTQTGSYPGECAEPDSAKSCYNSYDDSQGSGLMLSDGLGVLLTKKDISALPVSPISGTDIGYATFSDEYATKYNLKCGNGTPHRYYIYIYDEGTSHQDLINYIDPQAVSDLGCIGI